MSSGEVASGYRVYEVSLGGTDGVTKVYTERYEGSSTVAIMSSLESGRLYTYVVSAMSDAGESDVSEEMSASTAPGLVTGVASTHQTSVSISLSWSASAVSTGSAVAGYKVYSRVLHAPGLGSGSAGGSGGAIDHVSSGDGDAMAIDTLVYDGRTDSETATDRTTELNNLAGGTKYTYLVGAVSSSGESDRSAALEVSTCAPAPSGLVSVSQTTTGTVLLWNAPAMGSGSAVTGYVVYRNSGVGTSVDVVACNGRLDVTTSCAVSGLSGGVEYSYQVTALSSAGESDRSVAMESSTAPAQISGVSSSVQTTSSITLTWSAPTAEGAGQEATGYIVYRNDGLGGTSMSTVGYDGRGVDVPTGVISGLVGGREYEFVVSGLSAGGEGDVSAVLHQSTSPAAPTALRSTLQTTTSIALAWSAPVTEDGASAVTGYILYRNDGSEAGAVTTPVYESTVAASAMTSTAGTSIVVSGLHGGARYRFAVVAKSCLLYTSPSPRDATLSRMPSSA